MAIQSGWEGVWYTIYAKIQGCAINLKIIFFPVVFRAIFSFFLV